MSPGGFVTVLFESTARHRGLLETAPPPEILAGPEGIEFERIR
ncbi:hypothetical protein [Micrococcus sp.]|nr:hypothetical protein [Micrococcus sp.]MDO4240377.1 hypothetical protein [Micrococcus sp.]